MTLLLLTGPRGSGKSSLCAQLARLGREAGLDVAGLLSPARIVAGQKVGIDTVDLRTGQQRQLARQNENPAPGERAWRFDAAVIAWGNTILKTATPCDLLIVDELGPLEWEENRGWLAGLSALDSGQYRAAVAVVRPELLAPAQNRWPTATVIEASAVPDPRALWRVLLS